MWRRDYDDYGNRGNYEVRRIYITGDEEPEVFETRGMGRRGGGFSGGMSHPFSDTEIKQLGLAILLLSVAFAFALSNFAYNKELGIFIIMLIVSFIIVSTGFALHELAHKFAAQNYGHWAEFRYSEFGLLIALMAGFLGVVIAIPGAVYISGNVTREQNGKISAAGPLTNIALTAIFWGVYFAGTLTGLELLKIIGFFGVTINPILAGFNMIPLYPLDGSKIWRWNAGIYILMIAVIIPLIVISYTYTFF